MSSVTFPIKSGVTKVVVPGSRRILARSPVRTATKNFPTRPNPATPRPPWRSAGKIMNSRYNRNKPELLLRFSPYAMCVKLEKMENLAWRV
ncbi:hypothetical protein [Novosphingobium sp.]|uniref:hypothetical protein n=1 Tax=Novosphingobium sp. TaxID=1874826 RepID=UPI0025F9BAE3|nr:hypothetical protein [Novosphingobium sp.]